MVNLQKVGAETRTTLVVRVIEIVVTAMVTGAVAWWGKATQPWSWPVASVMAILFVGGVLWVLIGVFKLYDRVFGSKRHETAAHIQSVGAPATVRTELDQIKNQLAEAQAAVAKEGERYSAQVAQKAKVIDELFALQKARDYREGRWRQMYWRTEHDINTPEFASLNTEEATWVRRELSKFTTVLGELRDALPRITEDVNSRGLATGSANGASWMSTLVAEYKFRVCERSLNLVLEPGNSELDPREAFLAFVLSYRRVRAWIQRVAVVLQVDAININGYPEWWTAEDKLIAQLRQLPNDSPMKQLRVLVLRILNGERLP